MLETSDRVLTVTARHAQADIDRFAILEPPH